MIVYTEPYSGSNAMPADSAYGTSPGGSWVNRGVTDGGMEVSIATTRGAINVDQYPDPVLRPVTGRSVTLKGNLAQFTDQALLVAVGQGSVATVAATSGVRGHDEFTLTSTVSDSYYSALLDVQDPGDLEAIRTFVGYGLPSGTVNPKFGLATAAAMIPFEITAVPDPSTGNILKIRDIIQAA